MRGGGVHYRAGAKGDWRRTLMDKVCLIGGLRTYVGLTGGVYKHVPAELLGAAVLKEVVKKYNAVPQQIIAGNGVGAGGNIARLAALEALMKRYLP